MVEKSFVPIGENTAPTKFFFAFFTSSWNTSMLLCPQA